MKLQLKRSNVLDGGKAKEPTPPYVEYGELCVNYNVNDPALFIKDSNDNIIRIAGKNSVGSGSNPSGPNLPGTGNNIGDVFFNTGDLILYYWDGNQWVPIASQEHAADIYVGTFAEVDVEIPVADRRNGLLLWETEEGNLFLWYIDADTAQWVVAVPGGGSGGGGGSSNVTVLDVAPNNPKQGDLWYCTLDGRLYIYYEDVNTSQWVDASPDNLSEGFWERDGTTLKPVVAGDDVDLGTGNLSANAGTFAGGKTAIRASDGRVSVGNYNAEQSTAIYDGNVSIVRNDGADALSIFNAFGSSTPNITLGANGSATFTGLVSVDTSGTADSSYAGSFTNSWAGIRWQAAVVGKNATAGGPVWAGLAYDFTAANAKCTSSIYENGSAVFNGAVSAPNVTFNLEPEDPANFSAEGEYTGPTLDVKDRILNLISRLDALEANEVIDDATDTSLLQLIAAASARLDSIEARLTALEGGN